MIALAIAGLSYAAASIVGVALALRVSIRTVRDDRFAAAPPMVKALVIVAALAVTAVWPFPMIRKAVRW